MRTHHHRLIPILAALAAAFVLPTATPPAGEMSEVAGATFHAQVVQEIAADEQQEQGVFQTEQQIAMLANRAENLDTLPIQFWGQLTRPVTQMRQIIS
jgi:P-type conjugative transfer protein TrbJ